MSEEIDYREIHHRILADLFGPIGPILLPANATAETWNTTRGDLWLVFRFGESVADLPDIQQIADTFKDCYGYVLACEDEVSVHIRLYQPPEEDVNEGN